MTIPVLSLAAFERGGTDRDRFVTQLGQALETLGFLAIADHGIDPALIQQAYAQAQAFFHLPEATKQQYADPALQGQRGFTRFGQEHAKDHPFPDLKEFWHVGRDGGAYPANLTPTEVPDFHPTMQRLYDALEGCALTLLRACALYLGEPENRLTELCTQGNTILRIIHYPPVPPDAHPASLRAAPHEDINLITLLCAATASGLEIQTRSGDWLPVDAAPGTIVVDSGDMLQNLTNGLLKSTTHRVVNPANAQESRFSMPFFLHPRPAADLTPLPGCVARTGGTVAFPRITAGDYLQQRLREIGLA